MVPLCHFSRCQPLTWQCKHGSPWPGKMLKKKSILPKPYKSNEWKRKAHIQYSTPKATSYKSSGSDEYNLKLSSSLHFLHSSHLTGCKVTYVCSKEGMISAAFKNPFKISRRKRLEIYTRSEEHFGQSKKILVGEMMSCDPDRKPLACWVQQIKKLM